MRIVTISLIYLLLCGVLPLEAQVVSSLSRESRGLSLRPSVYPTYLPNGVEDESNRYTVPVDMTSVGVSSMQGSFGYLNAWIGRSVALVVESSSLPYSLWVNGERVGRASSGTTPSMFDITRFVVDNLNDIDIKFEPSSGSKSVAAWQRGVRELGAVYVISQPTMFIDDIVQRTNISGGVTNTYIGVVVRSRALNPRTSRINYQLYDDMNREVAKGYRDITLSMRGEGVVMIPYRAEDSALWSADSAKLHRLVLTTQYRGRHMELYNAELGVRTVEHLPSGEIAVNGEVIEVRAVRVAASATVEQLENYVTRGANAFVVGAGTYNREIYRWADSCGVYMIPTAAINSSRGGSTIKRGDNPTNDPAWRDYYVERADDIYRATQLHPSVIAFNLAEESLNGDNLYHTYLHLKGLGDPRPIIYLDGGGEWNSDTVKELKLAK